MKPVPELHTLLFPAFLTIGRSKKFEGTDYINKKTFIHRQLKSKKLADYKAYFGFKEDIPLPFFYLISQGAQTALMTEKSFPLPIPGMIHLETKLKQLAKIDSNAETVIRSEVRIKNKSEGSLLPIFTEEYYQNDIKVVEVLSVYLVKRRSKRKKSKRIENKVIENKESNWIEFDWKFKSNVSFKYARISGDYNPIHIFSLFAWFAGFKRKIAHGWFIASKIVAMIESETDMPAKSLEIRFLTAMTLPSRSKFEFRLSHDRNLEFRIRASKSDRFFASGIIE